MAEALHALIPRAAASQRGGGRLGLAPALTVLAFGLPIFAGLVGTLLPAFGYLPAIGGVAISIAPWRALLDAPGFATALQLTLVTGWLAALLSLLLALGIVAFVHHRPWARRLGEAMAPMLAMPHSALAIGLAFLITPSGWIVRLVSPGLTGWQLPPDVSTIGHPSGWPLIVALLLKEVPYLVLMLLAALNQVPARAHVALARSLGYGPVQAWFDVVLPQVYGQIRLPVYAVLAFSLSVVDVALILGPGNPPTLAVLAVRWFSDPDTRRVFPAAAAATLLLGAVAASILLWHGGERVMARALRARLAHGVRNRRSHALAGVATASSSVLLATAALAMLGIALWSVAAQWRYPDALPSSWTLATWQRQASSLALPALTTLVVGAAATLVALPLVLACLEHETQVRWRRTPSSLWLLYLPTLFAGGGRVATLTTEAVTLSAGADRRVISVWALLQAAFPLVAFVAAASVPRVLYRHRKGLS